MKKLLAILLTLAMVFAAVACSAKTEAPAAVEEPVVEQPVAEEPQAAEPKVEEPAAEEPKAEEPAEEVYAPLGLSFKNKTGATITGLYLYPAGAEDKGGSICPAEWKDKDADEANYEIFVYIVRPAVALDLYVEFADGTNATMPGLTIANHDKISMKDGADPAAWELEALDDAEDIAKADAAIAAGKTADNCYPGYGLYGLEIKNKTGKDIVEFYFYEEGGDYSKYPNMVPCLIDADGNAITSWAPGKGGLYVYDFFIRPIAEKYEVYVVYADGETMTVTGIDLTTPNGDGFKSNEISMKDAVDPDLTEVSYDDGAEDALPFIAAALAEGIPVDFWYPVY